MIKNCAVCQKEFITYPSKILLGRGKYCSKSCCHSVTDKLLPLTNGNRFIKGQKPHNFIGVQIVKARPTSKGYRLIFTPDHPHADKKGYVREHRLVMEQRLGRLLTKDEMVHHKDGDTLNNSLDNLELMSAADHRRHHLKDNFHKRWHERKISRLAASQ